MCGEFCTCKLLGMCFLQHIHGARAKWLGSFGQALWSVRMTYVHSEGRATMQHSSPSRTLSLYQSKWVRVLEQTNCGNSEQGVTSPYVGGCLLWEKYS